MDWNFWQVDWRNLTIPTGQFTTNIKFKLYQIMAVLVQLVIEENGVEVDWNR